MSKYSREHDVVFSSQG